jgi:hypothetical protein
MFGFTWRSGARIPSVAIRQALERDGLLPAIDAPAALSVVESRGRYAGRGVTNIRVFDPARAAERVLDVHTFGDLDTHRTLVLRTGHVEKDGTVVLDWRAPSTDAETPVRARADRAMHADDERFVFPQRFDFPVKDRSWLGGA